jgi:hypothetical protein
MGNIMKRITRDVLSTPEGRIRERALLEFSSHPAARPTSLKIGGHTNFM